MAAITGLLRLSWRERGLLAAALVLLPMTAAALRAGGFRHLRSQAAVPATRRRAPGQPSEAAVTQSTARMVAAASHYGPYRATCLPQSLVLQWMLRRQGIGTELRFGVRRAGGALDAHCWVEHQGRPLIDSPLVYSKFAPLARSDGPLDCDLPRTL